MKKALYALLCLFFPLAAAAATLPGPLVQTQWLADNLELVQVLDVGTDAKRFTRPPRWVKDKKGGKRLAALGGHIPGARFVDYRRIRSTRVIGGRKVTRMVPPRAQFEKVLQEAGVRAGRPMVIVSAGLGPGDVTMATRLYWQLKYFGEDALAILDGGLAKWEQEGRPVSTAPPARERGDWRARAERRELLATSEEVMRVVEKGGAQLVDTRPLSQYLGIYRKDYVYALGHIPKAKSFPVEVLTLPKAPATFVPVKDLRTLAETLGIDPEEPVVTYCNSGHLASGAWFVFSELLGNERVKLYDGSMHEWTLEGRPTVRLRMD